MRKEIIKSNSKIRIHDSIKETYIKELYRYYFNNPKEPLDLLVDFYNRIKAIDVGLNIKEEIDRLGSKVDDIYNYVKFVKERISDSSLSNKTLKDYKSIYNFDRKVEYRLGKKGVTVSYTWEHVRKDGLPDKRFSYNNKLLINRYYYYELSKFNFKVYDYQKNVEEIDEKYNQMNSHRNNFC